MSWNLQTADDDDSGIGITGREKSEVKLTMFVPDVGEVHKSTVFGMMNTSPGNLSKDRLRRVKSKHLTTSSPSSINVSEDVGLFDDVAVYMKNGKEHRVRLARVIRMRNKAKNFVEFKKPVSLNAVSQYPNLELAINFYTQKGEEYAYETFDVTPVKIGIRSIILKIKLTLNEHGRYILDPNDMQSIKEFENTMIKKKTKKSQSANTTAASMPSNSVVATEGRVVIETRGREGIKPNDDRRRSQRMRRLVMYEAQ